MGNPNPTGIGSNCGHIDQGTNALTHNRPPGGQCSAQPTQTELERIAQQASQQLAQAGDWFNTNQAMVVALGNQSFTAGAIYGGGKSIVMSAAGLLDLVRMLAMAEYHERYKDVSIAQRLVRAAVEGGFGPVGMLKAAVFVAGPAYWPGFEKECKLAFEQREVLIEAVKYAFTHPGEVFDKILADQKAKYEKFEKAMARHTLAGMFEAGELFGELLVELLSLIGAGVALAKLAAKIPRLAKLLPRLGEWGKAVKAAPKAVVRGGQGGAGTAGRAGAGAEGAQGAGTAAKGGGPGTGGKAGAAAESPASKVESSNKPANEAGSMCETAGCPISMVTGEEMLELEDFTWQGPLGFVWRRFYRSGHSDRDGLLGHGWLTPLDEWLNIGARVTVANVDGQRIDMPVPPPGGSSVNLPEKLRLHRDRDAYRLVGENGTERLFEARDGQCRLTGWQVRGGARIDVVRDADGSVIGLSSNWGRHLVIGYEGGRIASIGPATRKGGVLEAAGVPHVRYEYSAAGDLIATRDRLGQGERYRYEGHLLAHRALASGFGLRFEWDGTGPKARCLHNWGDGGNYDYTFKWQPGGVSHATDSRGGTTTYEHNAQGLLVRKRSPEDLETSYTYNAQNLRETETDPAGNVTRFGYNELGHLISVTDALGHTHRIERDSEGRALALTDPLGQRWSRRYDGSGRLLETREPNGAVTQYAWNPQGLLASIKDATGRTRRLLWDEQMRLVGDIGFDGVRRRYQYDAEDRIVAAVTQDKLSTRYEYDATGRLTAVHAPDGRSTRLGYNAFGLLTRYTDAAGHTTEYRYADGLSQVTSRIDALGQVMRYEYDLERNLVALENPKGERYTLSYDGDERLIAERGFDGREQRYEYGRAGHLLRHVAGGRAARVTEFERDGLGRLLSKRLADGSTARFSYDALGRLVSATAGASTVELGYDAAGRIVREVQDGQVVASGFDLLGRRTRLVTPGGQVLEFRHDEGGRLAGISLDGESLSSHRYDEFGREVGRTQGALATNFEHDPMGRLVRQQAQRASGKDAAVLGRRYGYDDAGRVASIEDLRQGGSGISRYIYDPVDRLVQVQGLTPERFVHDPAGNLLGESASGGLVKGDRLLVQGDRHYAYDEAGNLTEQRRGKGGHEVTRYAYDGDNRLIRVDGTQGRVEFGYDALGRRIFKRSASGETRFVYDGVHLLGETSAGLNRTFVFEPNSFRPLALVDEAEGAPRRISHYHLDHLGTPRELTSADGRVVWAARYRAYGALALADVQEVDNPLRFQGQYHDTETGLHYNLNRYYDPAAGRFIHQDPIGLAGGDNVYRYVPNPANWVDPWGLADEPIAYQLKPQDLDWRGSGLTTRDALDEAFRRTGVPRENFEVTKWGTSVYGKSVPVEYRALGGAEVNLDFPHTPGRGPDVPHIGWQTPGKNNQVGHILVDDVPAGRSKIKGC